MNCSLSDLARDNGSFCRSFDCKPCADYKKLHPLFYLTKEQEETAIYLQNVETEVSTVLDAVKVELTQAMKNWPPMNSAHEGYGVLMEEVDELWVHIKTKQRNRNLDLMRDEAIQIAAMAVRFAVEICNEERGRR